MKRLVSMCMAMIMVMTLSITAFAANSAPKAEEAGTRATAPPVSSVKIEQGKYLEESQWYPHLIGHYIVPVRIMGYGSVTATFDGKSVKSYDSEGILGAGNVAVGWIYYYDCGKPLPGEYVFEVKACGWQSVNVITARDTITIP